MANTVSANQGTQPGTIYIPGYGGIRLDQWLEDVVYDSVTIPNGAITAGTSYDFFSDIQNKNDLQTDMSEASKLPEGWEMLIMKMGLVIDPSMGATATDLEDIVRLISHSFIEFRTGNSKVRRRCPTWAWPIGMGLYADTADGSQAIAGVGMPSIAQAPNLLVPIRITSRLNFIATLEVSDAITISASSGFKVWFVLYGFVSQPVG